MPQSITIPLASVQGLHWLDWTTLIAYAMMMLGIGWYYAIRMKSVDDFMLGGRSMNPWFVGLSMFVTYMSVLSYLAMPGEMVQHGPIFLGQLLAFPIIFLIVTIWIIPFVMQRKVVSAYELLEERFGTKMRLLASSIFLIQRFLWMGVVIFAVVDVILIPIFKVPIAWLPYICVGLGLFTAIYSTMGGLKAVVVTDVIQSLILLIGALISIVYLIWLVGGDASWIWPERWQAHWPQENIWIGDLQTRITVFDSFLMALVWYVATAGSDQMAIQRYLAMDNVSDARKMYGVSVGSNVLIDLMLGVVGLGLLAYYTANSDLLPNVAYISGDKADRLFPLFILNQLPAGLSGLLIAAILAAAMSSLSSGINSSSSVVLVDFVERFAGESTDPKRRVLLARIISMIIGLIIVGLSVFVANVQGNLLEVCGRVVNLLVGPLFVTFFLAIFIPWSSKRGVWIATITSLFVAIFVAFPGAFGVSSLNLGFNWILILSLVIGIILGAIFSAILPDKKISSV